MPIAFIAVHAGAGIHTPSKHAALCALMKEACSRALNGTETPQDAVRVAVAHLESSALTNAGNGSCLTEDGRVECEAAVMMGNGSFGGVGAVQGVEHPIDVAFELCRDRNENGLVKELGRIRPIILTGEGAYRYAKDRGLQTAAPEELAPHHVDADIYKRWQHYKAIVEAYDAGSETQRAATRAQLHQQTLSAVQRKWEQSNNNDAVTGASALKKLKSEVSDNKHDNVSERTEEDDITEIILDRPDTVGAIACDFEGHVSAAISSGGIWLKVPGRLGCSSSFGSGCFAVDSEDGDPSVASSVSGCGEDITEQLLALRTCDALKTVQMNGGEQSQSACHVDGSITTTPPLSALHSVMKRLLVKRMCSRSGTAHVNKRSENDAGSVDVINEGIEFPTGIIALQAQKTTDNTLCITFCSAHTSPHLAIGVASAHHPTADAWISQNQQSPRNQKQHMIMEMELTQQNLIVKKDS